MQEHRGRKAVELIETDIHQPKTSMIVIHLGEAKLKEQNEKKFHPRSARRLHAEPHKKWLVDPHFSSREIKAQGWCDMDVQIEVPS